MRRSRAEHRSKLRLICRYFRNRQSGLRSQVRRFNLCEHERLVGTRTTCRNPRMRTNRVRRPLPILRTSGRSAPAATLLWSSPRFHDVVMRDNRSGGIEQARRDADAMIVQGPNIRAPRRRHQVACGLTGFLDLRALGSGSKNTRHCGDSCCLFRAMQAVMRSTSGISGPQSRIASGLQACCCSSV